MRLVFMGTPSFAVPTLKSLACHHEVVAVFTRRDAASGRGRSLRPSAVKQVAVELGIPVQQPDTLRDEQVQQELRRLAPDAIVVAAYGLILPREVLDIPPQGCLNVHGSLLPRWRGAAPVQRAILAGDEVTGVSIMRMEEGLDTGPYCLTASTDVDEKTVNELTEELAQIGAELMQHALTLIAEDGCQWVRQDETAVTYAEKIGKLDVALHPGLTVDEALRRVRASSDQAPSRLSISGRGVTVLEARVSDSPVEPSSVSCSKTSLFLGFSDGSVEATRIKPDGKAPMAGCDWVRGARLTEPLGWGEAS